MTTRLVARARARAVLVLFSFRAACALLLAYPVARTIGAFLPPAFPLSDALLFAPGGYYAAEALRLGGRAIQASLEGSAPGFVLVAVVASFPFAVALSSLTEPSEALPLLVKRGAACTPPLVAIAGATALAQAAAVVAIAVGAAAVYGVLGSALDERQADLTVTAIVLVASSSLVVLGLAADLARAAAVRHGARATRAAATAAGVLRRAPVAVLTGWLPAALAGVAAVAASAWAASALDVSRPGAARVWAVALLHQTTVLALVALRIYWLERALALVGPAPSGGVSEAPRPSLADTPARSAAPDDPTPDPAA